MNNNFKINDWVKIIMKNKSVIGGQVMAFGTKLVDGKEHDFYQVRILDDRETTVFDVQIESIEKLYTQNELEEMVIEIADKYGVNAEEQPDFNNKLAGSIWRIIGYWTELSDEERRIVCNYLGNPEWSSIVIGIANDFYSAYINSIRDLQEIKEKQAEKDKMEQDKSMGGLIEKYYEMSKKFYYPGSWWRE